MARQKTKMISIRVSDAEYELVKSQYASTGRRSVSAFARDALQIGLRPPVKEEGDPTSQVRQLADKLTTLQSEVSLLTRMVSERLTPKTD